MAVENHQELLDRHCYPGRNSCRNPEDKYDTSVEKMATSKHSDPCIVVHIDREDIANTPADQDTANPEVANFDSRA